MNVLTSGKFWAGLALGLIISYYWMMRQNRQAG